MDICQLYHSQLQAHEATHKGEEGGEIGRQVAVRHGEGSARALERIQKINESSSGRD